MENENYEYRRLLAEDLTMQFREWKSPIVYATSDGKKFEDRYEAQRHDLIVSRQAYYEYLLKNRNWFMKLFNIKPSMKFYDETTALIYKK